MQSTKNTQYSVLQEGALKEETWEWDDLAAMCRAGRMSPESLVFIPEDNGWKKLHDTPLAEHFGADSASETAESRESSQLEDISSRYDALIGEMNENPNDNDLTLNAAELALAKGDVEAACGHYQRALEISPYHPRVGQEAKRNLPASKWRTLRFLDKPPHVWEEPLSVLAFPFTRGPLYFLIPAVVLAGFSLTLWSLIPAVFVMALWAIETIRSSLSNERKPPLWHGVAKDPFSRVLKPMLAATVNVAGLLLPFVVIAGVLMAMGKGAGPDIVTTIKKSPVMTVVAITAVLFCFPAVLSVAASANKRLIDMINPRRIFDAIRVMELEYLAAALFIAVLLVATWGGGRLFEAVPVFDRVYYAAAAVYILLAGGFVIGRVYARFAERLDSPGPAV